MSQELKPISRIASKVQASTTLAIDAMFKDMKASGVDVVAGSYTHLTLPPLLRV